MSERADIEAELEAAVRAVRAGAVIGLPTDTVYGIGVDPSRPDATARIFAVKGRPETVALPVLLADPSRADELGEIGVVAARLIEHYWPGPLTIVVPRRRGVSLHLGGDGATVGLRCPGRGLTRRLLARSGPLAVTSANRHGEPPATTAAEVRSSLGDGVEIVLDGGLCDGAPSSVVSLAGETPEVLRVGAISEEDLAGAFG